MVEVVCASITDDVLLNKADAVVNSSDPEMKIGAGIPLAIFRKAGEEELTKYCNEYFSSPMEVGEVRITPGFNIPCDIIFAHAPVLYSYLLFAKAKSDLLLTYKEILDTCIKKQYKTILIPLLGTGLYGFEHEDIEKDVMTLLLDKKYYKINIILVNNNKKVCYIYKERLYYIMQQIGFTFFVIDDKIVACMNKEKKTYAFINNKWIRKPYNFVNDLLEGFDESEPEGSQYRYGNFDIMKRIFRITKEYAEKILGQSIDENELIMREDDD